MMVEDKKHKELKTLIIAIILLTTVDASLTFWALNIGIEEGNPIITSLINTFGALPAMILYILLVIFLAKYILKNYSLAVAEHKWWSWVIPAVLFFKIFQLLFVIVFNTAIIKGTLTGVV